MKKTVLAVLCMVLSAGLVLGLSACSIDIRTGGKNSETYTIDLGEIDPEALFSGIAEAFENIDPEKLISDAKNEISAAIEHFISSLVPASQSLPEGTEEETVINSSGNDVRDVLEETLESLGFGASSGYLADMIISNIGAENLENIDPEELRSMLTMLFSESSGSSGNESADGIKEAAPAAEPEYDAGVLEAAMEQAAQAAKNAVEAAQQPDPDTEEQETVTAFQKIP